VHEGSVGEQKQTFDGGIVFVYKVGLDELDGEAGFADATAADDNELVLAEKLGEGH